MNISFANITETRTKMPELTKQALNDDLVILLKNGKPLLGLLKYEEVQAFQKWKESQFLAQKKKEWAASLPMTEIPEAQAESISEARKNVESESTLSWGVNDPRPASEVLGLKES